MKKRILNFILLGTMTISCLAFISCNTTVEIIDDNISIEKNENIKEEDTSQDIEEEENEKDNSNKLTKEEVFNKYKDFLINNNGKSQYRGYAEYGYDLSKPTINTKESYIEYTGVISDGYGEDDRGLRDFTIRYDTFVIDKYFKIIENITNRDYMNENKNSLNSIIPNYIVIYNKMDIGTHWEQDFEYKGKTYTAKTRVMASNNDMYKIETIVKDINGFYDNTYKEERVYERGFGLTSFSNTPNYEEGTDFSDLLFGYNLNK